MRNTVFIGDCLKVLNTLDANSIDLVYMDPPFFTRKDHSLLTRDRLKEFKFTDTWESLEDYTEFLKLRLKAIFRVIKSTGTIFFHCDRNAAHIARYLMDEIFGSENFRSEIIWTYRRWSNSATNLLPAHQNILFYSKSSNYKFNFIMQDYSPSTNIDQILQKRERDRDGKSVYARDLNGCVISNGSKKGVPLSDVWDIPYLNPKAHERVGYPTQKPILLLQRIIELVTDKNDLVLDPFCGSGTTLVAASMLERNSIGIDISQDAIEITQERLENPVISRSQLLERGRESYNQVSDFAIKQLSTLDIIPVHRNKGIDAFLKQEYENFPVPIRVQRPGESVYEAANLLYQSSKTKNCPKMILVSTEEDLNLGIFDSLPENIIIVDSISKVILSQLRKIDCQP
jgi:site-specific DNA-methyltransferase (adenine-specific)